MENEHYLDEGRFFKYDNSGEANNMVNSMETTSYCSGSMDMDSSEIGEGIKSQELAGSLPDGIFVYRRDVVTCREHGSLLGAVMEVAGEEDSEGSMTDDSDIEDGVRYGGNGNGGGGGGDGNGKRDGDNEYDLLDGQVRVIWTDGSDTRENIGDITVVDRGFLHGDTVASASDPTGQLGIVMDAIITVDLLTSNGEVIKNVSSKDLRRVREPIVGDYVVLGPWLGRVDDVLDDVTVLFDDGSICKVMKADPLRLKPLSRPVADNDSSPFYPGLRVRASTSSVFRTSRWLSGLWKANRLEGTVIKVQAVSVVVYWIASAYFGIGTNASTFPSEEQDPKNLNVLSCLSYTNWQLGDWCHLLSSPLPSSFSDETSKTSNVPIEGSRSSIKHSDECSAGEYMGIHINSWTEGSGQALLGDHQASEIPNPEGAVQDEPVESINMVMPEDLDLDFVSGHQTDGCSENSSTSNKLEGNYESRRCDSPTPRKTTGVGANGTESNNVLSECGSCSSSSSFSKEPAHENWPSISNKPHENWPAYRKRIRKVFFKRDKKVRRRDETFERALFIKNIVTKVDVAWQSGTTEYGVDPRSIIPIHNLNDQEFFPEQYVLEMASNEVGDSSDTDRVGIVRSVNSKERTACVKWFKTVSRLEDSREFDCDELVSAFELDAHPDYDYCHGDVVVRLPPVSVSADTAEYGSPAEQLEQHADLVEAEDNENRKHSYYNEAEQLAKDEASSNFTRLSWVGHITGLQDGNIEVTWADGMVSKVGAHAIVVVGRRDDSFDGGSDISDDVASWETIDENEMDKLESAEKDLRSINVSIVEMEKQTAIPPVDINAVTNGPLSTPLSALGFVTRMAMQLFSRERRQVDLPDGEHKAVHQTESMEIVEVSDKTNDELSSEEYDPLDNLGAQNAPETAERHIHVAVTEDAEMMLEDNLDSPMSVETNAGSTEADSKDDPNFKHFDIAENPLDHHFLGSSEQNAGGRKWVKKVQQEWSILEGNLPDAIYVRAFEDRMDLLRAVIVGAFGTPYQDGLFFFDFRLSPEYPQVPPLVNYHSCGLRVNPNLYVDGKVCLSLLNTWSGKSNEVWDPSSSSILQVLVSLQGLVLNSKPYFNEAGYEKQVGTVEGEKNSLPYNENTYLLNLKSMLYLLRRPPMHFEGFVKDHFRRRGPYILKACEAYYMGGCMIGSLTKDARLTETSGEHPCSTGFKLILAKLLPKLISALREVGVDCQRIEYLHKSQNLLRS